MGPYRVLACGSDYVFLIEKLLTSKKEEVHCRRLKFFRNKDYKVIEEMLDHLVYQQGELHLIHSFFDIRKARGNVEPHLLNPSVNKYQQC